MGTIRRVKGTSNWLIDLRRTDGTRIRVSTKTRDRVVAKKILKAFEGRVAAASLIEQGHAAMEEPKSTAINTHSTEWISTRWNTFNPRERQAVLFAVFEGRCHYCKRLVVIPVRRQQYAAASRCVMDHRIPRVAGGSDSFANMVLSCQECNQENADRGYEAFEAEMQSRRLQTFSSGDGG